MHYRNSLHDPKPPRPWRDVGLILLAVALLGCIWLVSGCGERAAAAVVAHVGGAAAGALPEAPAPTSTAAADADLKLAHAERDSLADRIDVKDAQIRRLEAEREMLAQRDTQRRLAWFGEIVLIGVLACVGLWFVLPTGLKSWAVYGGMACLGIAAAAFVLRALVPHLYQIGCGMMAAGAAFGLWKLARIQRAGAVGATAFDRLEEAFVGIKDWIPKEQHELVDGLIADVKHQAATDQAAAGVRGVLACLRGKDPKKPTTPPPPPLVVPG